MPIDPKKIEEWKARIMGEGGLLARPADAQAARAVLDADALEAAREAIPALLAEVERLDGFLRGPPFAEGVEARAVAYRSWDDMVSTIESLRDAVKPVR